MAVLLALLIAAVGLVAEVGGLRTMKQVERRKQRARIAALESELQVGIPLEDRIRLAVEEAKVEARGRHPWEGMTLEELDVATDPDVTITVWPARLPRERRRP